MAKCDTSLDQVGIWSDVAQQDDSFGQVDIWSDLGKVELWSDVPPRMRLPVGLTFGQTSG